jgi:hypothetical protein
MGFIERNKAALNDRVSRSIVGKYFHLDGSGHVCQHHVNVESTTDRQSQTRFEMQDLPPSSELA